MKDQKHGLVRGIAGLAALALLLFAARMVEGHAVLKSSSPEANATVTSPDVPVILKFNVRIDAARSKVQLLHPDTSTTDLALETQSSPDTLTAKATGLTPGKYQIQWQVLAPDGHITRGIVPFTVKAA